MSRRRVDHVVTLALLSDLIAGFLVSANNYGGTNPTIVYHSRKRTEVYIPVFHSTLIRMRWYSLVHKTIRIKIQPRENYHPSGTRSTLDPRVPSDLIRVGISTAQRQTPHEHSTQLTILLFKPQTWPTFSSSSPPH